MERQANRTQGETMGTEQEPTQAGDQDQAERDPQPGGPLRPDPEAASERFGESPDAAYGQRESQAEEGSGPEHAEPAAGSTENTPTV